MGLNGMVSSGHPLASQAGIQVLRDGGNAVDAAIATAAALGVVEPAMSGPGGDGFMLIYMADQRKVFALNATGPAPAAATREYFVTRGGIPMRGIGSVSVPGIVDGWIRALDRFGALPRKTVFGPAIALCEDGFPVSPKLAEALAPVTEAFASDEPTRDIFTRAGSPLQPGQILNQRALGGTLRNIAETGSEGFYRGEIARSIGEFSRARGGLLTADDLAAYASSWDDPIQTTYRGVDVYEMPPNSSGHVLLQELNIVERFDLGKLGCNSAECIHLMVEAKRLAFADRETWMADPRWVDVPINKMLSKDYAARQAERIHPDRSLKNVVTGIPEATEDTTCFCTADGKGNLVCMLQSIQMGFGSLAVAGETGILLNNRMTYWHLDEQHPNCLQPGKRVRHTMNPVIAVRESNPFLALGTPGADTQVQTNLQLLSHIIDFGMTPQEAVSAPRWRHLQNPMESTIPHTCVDALNLESRFPPMVCDGLSKRGHNVQMLGGWSAAGSAQAIHVHPESGALIGGSDPRRDGYSIAW